MSSNNPFKQMLNVEQVPVKLQDTYARAKHMLDRLSGGERYSPHLLVLIALVADCEVRPAESLLEPSTKRGPGRPRKEPEPVAAR